ncbi:hypothetical protein FRZ03_17120 [Streptomyces misionensis]|uniref:Ketopantoate reductase N-terminal domain-containing protein n=1 Tax=Streptomyces misionensis TaxID=67331 RepID=A0A5C6JTK6_9ACTN|nr:hypothetical protein FRZ03_17120 [Streptomyces misionensis]
MRCLVIGAGAVGGAVGGRPAQAGREVVLVARGTRPTALGEHGLRPRVPEGETGYRLPAVGARSRSVAGCTAGPPR